MTYLHLKLQAAVISGVSDSHAVRTEEMLALRDRLGEKDSQLASLKTDLGAITVENVSLKQENASLTQENLTLKQELARLNQKNQELNDFFVSSTSSQQEMRAMIRDLHAAMREQGTHMDVSTTPVRPLPRSTSTPASETQMSPLALSCTDVSIQLPRQHPDVILRNVGPEDHASIHHQSYGQVGRYGCLLFRRIISEEKYREWSKTTNWDGSRGKRELPQNLKNYLVDSLKQKFPGMQKKDLKEVTDKINEYLRTTRKSYQEYSFP